MKNTHTTTNGITLRYTTRTTEEPTYSCVILLPGIPYDPEKEYPFIENLKRDQYDTHLVHYAGTWGSGGKFLASNPTESVNDFVDAISSGKITNTAGKAYKKIFVIGTSFGGGLALTLKNHALLGVICALSPVISYTSVNGIKALGQYLKDSCDDHYDFDMSDMDALINDEIIAPEKQFTLPTRKVLVFGGSYDEQIPFNDIAHFCERHDLELKECPIGHITFSKITDDIYKVIVGSFN